jgi:hypothetical protein
MKNWIMRVFKFIQENQNGLFKIAVLLILLYWTHLFKFISYNGVDLSSIESVLNDISSKLADIDTTLTHR